jgi:hypothetical protein
VVSVDAGDKEVACLATEQGLEQGLHRIVCETCQTPQLAAIPFTYHDATERLFVLVLPEGNRSRELEERATLLHALANETIVLPEYVVEPVVVYGSKGLSEFLVARLSERDDESRDTRRLHDVETRIAEASKREERIAEQERTLLALTKDLDGRSSQLTEKELGLRDRKGALDRRSQELERMTVAIEEVKQQLRAESQGDLPAVLREDATEALGMDDILTSAPSPEREAPVASVTIASGSAETNSRVSTAPSDPLGLEEAIEEAPILLMTAQPRVEPQARVEPQPAVEPQPVAEPQAVAPQPRVAPRLAKVPANRAASEMITGEHIELSPPPAETVPDLKVAPLEKSAAPAESIAEPAAASGQHLAPQTEVGDQDITVPSTTGSEVESWRRKRGTHLKVLHAHEVSLVASVRPSALEELLAADIRALLQLHRMPSYPLISLTLARATTLAGQPGKPYSFHFDIGDTHDRAILSQLSDEFRFRLEVFDADHKPIRQRRLAAPLASNVNYVMALATDARKELPPHQRDFAQAVKAFDNKRYDRLGRGHRLARDFKDSLLDHLETPTALLGAIAQCGRFSASPGEEYLVAIRSYPFERWHQRRLHVIRKAMSYGLWMGAELARVAVSEELVRSRRELLALCQTNFQALVDKGESGLSESSIKVNWAALAAEADAIGVSMPKAPRAPSPVEIDSEERRLLAQLEEPGGRLQAIVSLCEMKSLSGMDPVFRALAQLDSRQAAEAFAAITKLGNQAAESLLVLLSCPSGHLRHGAALALCELGNEEGIDSTCESLMTSEGTIWREFAVALGRVGSSAVMPLVARIGASGQRGQARAVWALSYMALGGASKPVETLAGGRDQAVSHVAKSALELRQRLQDKSIESERSAVEQEFTEAFTAAVLGKNPGYASADLSGPAMLLDDADLIEAT